MRHDSSSESSYGLPVEPWAETDEPDQADPGMARQLDVIGLIVCAVVTIGLCIGLGNVLGRQSGASGGRSGWLRTASVQPVAFAGVPGEEAPALCAAPTVQHAAWPSPVPAVDRAPATRCADMIPTQLIMRPAPVRWL